MFIYVFLYITTAKSMPFQKGLQNYNIFSIYANFHVDYLTFFAEKAIFTPIYLHMCEKTTTFAEILTTVLCKTTQKLNNSFNKILKL